MRIFQIILLVLAGVAFIVGAIFIIFFYKNPDVKGAGKSLREIGQGLVRVVKDMRFMALIIITSGFRQIS